jgi:hypothetical protein
MQCPTCGKNTPGTLSRCVRCDAPISQRPPETPGQEPQAHHAPPAGGSDPVATQQFGHGEGTWNPAPASEADRDPQSRPGSYDSGPQSWTSDSEAIERWASATPLTGGTGHTWSSSAETAAAPPGQARQTPADPWSQDAGTQWWSPEPDSASASPGASGWSPPADPPHPEPERSAAAHPASGAGEEESPYSVSGHGTSDHSAPDSVDAWYAPPSPPPGRPGGGESAQSWSSNSDAPEPDEPGGGTDQSHQPAKDARSRTPDMGATQVWSQVPASGAGDSRQGQGGPGTRDGESAESIVPDSWFAGSQPGPRQPAEQWPPHPTERSPQPTEQSPHPTEQWSPRPSEQWSPQPSEQWSPRPSEQWSPRAEPANQGPWGPQPEPGTTSAWGAQPHNGPGAMPHHDNAMPGQGFSPSPHQDFSGPQHYGYPPAEQKRGRAGKPMILGVAGLVVVALVAVAFVMWPDSPEKPQSRPTPAAVTSSAKVDDPVARKQALTVNSLLNASAASRGELGRALVAAKQCKGLPAAIQAMKRVAQQRQLQISRTRRLQVDSLSGGTQLRAHLAKSMQISLDVDKAYLSWAQHASHGCKGRPKGDANYRRGGQLSNQATVSKQRFAALWAPVATEQKLRPRTANQF